MSVIDWPRLHVELVPVRLSRPLLRDMITESVVPVRKRCKARSCFHCGYLGGNTLVVVDGLDGQYECPNVRACEQRIVSGSVI